jgi:hypothetical protein
VRTTRRHTITFFPGFRCRGHTRPRDLPARGGVHAAKVFSLAARGAREPARPESARRAGQLHRQPRRDGDGSNPGRHPGGGDRRHQPRDERVPVGEDRPLGDLLRAEPQARRLSPRGRRIRLQALPTLRHHHPDRPTRPRRRDDGSGRGHGDRAGPGRRAAAPDGVGLAGAGDRQPQHRHHAAVRPGRLQPRGPRARGHRWQLERAGRVCPHRRRPEPRERDPARRRHGRQHRQRQRRLHAHDRRSPGVQDPHQQLLRRVRPQRRRRDHRHHQVRDQRRPGHGLRVQPQRHLQRPQLLREQGRPQARPALQPVRVRAGRADPEGQDLLLHRLARDADADGLDASLHRADGGHAARRPLGARDGVRSAHHRPGWLAHRLPRQHHSRKPHGPGRGQGPQLLPAAQPAWFDQQLRVERPRPRAGRPGRHQARPLPLRERPADAALLPQRRREHPVSDVRHPRQLRQLPVDAAAAERGGQLHPQLPFERGQRAAAGLQPHPERNQRAHGGDGLPGHARRPQRAARRVPARQRHRPHLDRHRPQQSELLAGDVLPGGRQLLLDQGTALPQGGLRHPPQHLSALQPHQRVGRVQLHLDAECEPRRRPGHRRGRLRELPAGTRQWVPIPPRPALRPDRPELRRVRAGRLQGQLTPDRQRGASLGAGTALHGEGRPDLLLRPRGPVRGAVATDAADLGGGELRALRPRSGHAPKGGSRRGAAALLQERLEQPRAPGGGGLWRRSIRARCCARATGSTT